MRHLQIFRFVSAVHRAGSIRKAAEDLNMTASALTRRIRLLEEELGSEIFERLPRGMLLNPAGEILLAHFQAQEAALRRTRAQIDNLGGLRAGHVEIVCSQAFLPSFLPAEIARFRASHPGITFGMDRRDRAEAETHLSAFRADLALIFEPVYMAEIETMTTISQPVHAVMAHDHPLAANDVVRLRDCLAFPHIMPRAQYGVRTLLEEAMPALSRPLAPVVEADSFEFMVQYPLHEQAIGFQIPIGLAPSGTIGLTSRPISNRDVRPGSIILAQLRRRGLPSSAAAFAAQVIESLHRVNRGWGAVK